MSQAVRGTHITCWYMLLNYQGAGDIRAGSSDEAALENHILFIKRGDGIEILEKNLKIFKYYKMCHNLDNVLYIVLVWLCN